MRKGERKIFMGEAQEYFKTPSFELHSEMAIHNDSSLHTERTHEPDLE